MQTDSQCRHTYHIVHSDTPSFKQNLAGESIDYLKPKLPTKTEKRTRNCTHSGNSSSRSASYTLGKVHTDWTTHTEWTTHRENNTQREQHTERTTHRVNSTQSEQYTERTTHRVNWDEHWPDSGCPVRCSVFPVEQHRCPVLPVEQTNMHTKMGSSILKACKHKCTQCPWDALGCPTALQDLLLVFQLFLNCHVEQNSQNECFRLALTYLLAGRKLHPV